MRVGKFEARQLFTAIAEIKTVNSKKIRAVRIKINAFAFIRTTRHSDKRRKKTAARHKRLCMYRKKAGGWVGLGLGGSWGEERVKKLRKFAPRAFPFHSSGCSSTPATPRHAGRPYVYTCTYMYIHTRVGLEPLGGRKQQVPKCTLNDEARRRRRRRRRFVRAGFYLASRGFPLYSLFYFRVLFHSTSPHPRTSPTTRHSRCCSTFFSSLFFSSSLFLFFFPRLTGWLAGWLMAGLFYSMFIVAMNRPTTTFAFQLAPPLVFYFCNSVFGL